MTTPLYSCRFGFRPKRSARRIASIVTLGLAAGLSIRWYDVNHLPALPEVSPRFYQQGSGSGPNAAHFYAAAADALTDEAAIHGHASDLLPHAPLARQQAIVAANSESLRLLRVGFAYRYQGQATRWMKTRPQPEFSTPVPNFVIQRQMARLLAADARVKAAAGDKGAAIQSCLDTIRFGQDIGNGKENGLIGAMIGQLCVGIGLETALTPGLVSSLSAQEARVAARRLEALLEQSPTAADALRSEKRLFTAALHRELQSPRLARETIGNKPFLLPLLRYGKQGMLDNYTSYMDAVIQRASQPYASTRKSAPPPIPPDPICQAAIPNIDKAMLSFTQKKTQARILLTQLALQAYRKEHAGASPVILSALTQGPDPYLTRVPRDPFSPNGTAPLRYEKGRAYSVENGN